MAVVKRMDEAKVYKAKFYLLRKGIGYRGK